MHFVVLMPAASFSTKVPLICANSVTIVLEMPTGTSDFECKRRYFAWSLRGAPHSFLAYREWNPLTCLINLGGL